MKRMFAFALCCALVLSCVVAHALAYTQDFFLDDSGPGVKRLQERLAELGYLKGDADGWYGEGTKSAVERFQEVNGLKMSGMADRGLQTALFAGDARPLPESLMSLDELVAMMSTPNPLVTYDMSSLVVEGTQASVALNADTTLYATLVGARDVTEIRLVGEGNVKIPFTVMLMKLDKSIDNTGMYTAVDEMIEFGDRYIGNKRVTYENNDGVESLIVVPYTEPAP